MNNRIAYLISKKLSEEISGIETHELNSWLAADPSLYEIISLLEIAWKNEPDAFSESSGGGDVIRLLQKLKIEAPGFMDTGTEPQTLNDPPVLYRNRFPLKRLIVAASLAVLLFLSWKIWAPGDSPSNQIIASAENKVVTQPGNRTQVVLRDGTKVWLNGDSKLTYKQLAVGKLREVYLSGEGYFEVVSNPARPFIIHTEKTTVKVTGTTLNVRDYPGEEKAETSLLSGKAEVVAANNPSNVIYLKPNEKVVFSRNEPVKDQKDREVPEQAEVLVSYNPKILKISYYPIDSFPVVTAWVSDQLAFSDESFRDIADKMEKWYNVSIEFRSVELEEARLTGKFEKETLPEALQALQFSTPFQYTIKGNNIIIDKH